MSQVQVDTTPLTEAQQKRLKKLLKKEAQIEAEHKELIELKYADPEFWRRSHDPKRWTVTAKERWKSRAERWLEAPADYRRQVTRNVSLGEVGKKARVSCEIVVPSVKIYEYLKSKANLPETASASSKAYEYPKSGADLPEIAIAQTVLSIEAAIERNFLDCNYTAVFAIPEDHIKFCITHGFLWRAPFANLEAADYICGLIREANVGHTLQVEEYIDEAEIKSARLAEAAADPSRAIKFVNVTVTEEREFVIPTAKINQYLKKMLKFPDDEISATVTAISKIIKQANKNDASDILVIPWVLIKGCLMGKTGRTDYQSQLLIDALYSFFKDANYGKVSANEGEIVDDYELPRPVFNTL